MSFPVTRTVLVLSLAAGIACEDPTIKLDDPTEPDGSGFGDSADDTEGSTLETGDPGDSGSGGDTAPAATWSTCRDVRTADSAASDGPTTLYAGGDPVRPWTAWCHDMAGTPREYLTLVAGPRANYSQYTVGGRVGTRTSYTRVRIDPVRFLVDISDGTFSTSEGGFQGTETYVASMPYAVAMSCDDAPTGVGNLDLTATPFRVAEGAFFVGGYQASGTATYGASGQTVALAGGGYCGWIGPGADLYNPVNDTGGFLLPLVYGG